MADDPNSIGAGAPDPYVQSLIDKYRQQQLAQQLASGGVGNPKNMGEGVQALGTGFINMLQGFKTLNQNQQNLALGNALAGQIGNQPITSPPPLPTLTPPSMVSPGSASTGSLPTPIASAGQTSPSVAMATPSGADPIGVGLAGIAKVESGGTKDPYGIVNSIGATGKYQMMPGFLDHYASGAGYPEMTTRALKGNAQAQEDIARYAYSQMLNKGDYPGGNFPSSTGDPNLVAHGWLSGHPTGNPRDRVTGISANDYAANATANLPSSFGVPPGQTAGPAVPSNLPSPIPRPAAMAALPQTAVAPAGAVPGFRDNLGPGVGGGVGPAPTALAADGAPQSMGPTPSSVNPALSPTPMGPPQGFVPPGGDPGAAVGPPAAAPPVAPQAAPRPAGIPPVAASAPVPVQAAAPAAGGSAYDPRTGRFLAPGEQLPGYAPAPMTSTGSAVGGLNGLLASLFSGGGRAVPAAAPPTALASSLGGQPPVPAGGGQALPPAPRGYVAPVGASVSQGAGPSGPPGGAVSPAVPSAPGNTTPNPLLAPLDERYKYFNAQANNADAQARSYEQQAARYFNTPAAAIFQQQATAARTQANAFRAESDKTFSSYLDIQKEANPPAARVMTDAEKQTAGLGDTEGVYTIKPDGTISQVTGSAGESKPTSVKEFEYGKAHPEFAKASRWVPNARTGPLGEPIGDWVQPPNPAAGGVAPPVSPAVGNQPATDPTSGLTDEQKAAVGTPNSYTLPKTSAGTAPLPGLQLTKEQNAALANIPPERQGMVRAILANDMELPKVTAKNKLGNLLNQDVRNVIPDFDAQSQAGRVAAKKEFLSGGNQSLGKQIEFGDTAISHLADVPELSDNVDKQLGNPSEGPLSGVVGGAGAQAIGAHIGAYTTGGGGAMDAIHAKALTFSGELSKYLTGGEGTEAQREEQASFLSGAKTTYERKLNALGLLDTIAGRKDFIQSAWHNAAGPNVADFPVMSPIAQKKMDEIRAWATSGDGAVDPITKAPKDQAETPPGGLQGGEQVPAAPPAVPAAAPSNAYPGAGAQTYAPGTYVVPGSTAGKTPSCSPGMLKGEQDTRDPYYIAAGGVGPALALALGPSLARLGIHAGGKVLGGALTGAGLAGGGARAWKYFK